MNPFYDAHETSLSKLSEHDWQIARNRWFRGIDWNVSKLGKGRWELTGEWFKGQPIFKTRTAAYDAGEALIRAESRHRKRLEWEGEREHA